MTSSPALEATIEVPETPAQVWTLLGDLTNMPRWSPQVRKSIVKGGVTKRGATMINLNRRGALTWWPTRAKVVTYDPAVKIAFRVLENATVWSFTLEPTSTGGTKITERREAPNGISGLSLQVQKAVLGGQESFEKELVAGMHQTLERLAKELSRR